jgi:replicative DNA helicase
MAEANFEVASDRMFEWREDTLSGQPPTLYPLGTGRREEIEVGPGQVLLLGGAPGSGKTAFAIQGVLDALRRCLDLRVVVCSVEMPLATLLDRQLARVSGVPLTLIRHRQLGREHDERIDRAMATLEPLLKRFAMVKPPSTSKTPRRVRTRSSRK